MFESLFGQHSELARIIVAFLAVLGLIGGIVWLVRLFGAARLGGGSARGRQPRLAVIDSAPVDSRRRLLLIRRDNVEHLLMIGGPTDVVVEQSIVRAQSQPREAPQMRGTGTTDALPRPIPLDDSVNWPLQPQAEPTPLRPQAEPAPARPQRPAAAEESGSWQTAPQPEPLPRVVRPLHSAPAPEDIPRWSQPSQPAPQAEPVVRLPRAAAAGAAGAAGGIEPILRAQAARPEPGTRTEPIVQVPSPAPPVEPPIAKPVHAEPAPMSTSAAPDLGFIQPERAPQPRPSPEPDVATEQQEFHPEPPPEPRAEAELHVPPPPAAAPIMPEVAQPAVQIAAPEPAPPAPAKKPVAEVALTPEADDNLAEMALRLEAALRGPVGANGQTGKAPPPAPTPVPDGEAGATSEPPAPAKPKPAGRTLYANLEEEMANLLGRSAAGNKG